MYIYIVRCNTVFVSPRLNLICKRSTIQTFIEPCIGVALQRGDVYVCKPADLCKLTYFKLKIIPNFSNSLQMNTNSFTHNIL